MANVGSAEVSIQADDSQARATVKGFMGFLQKTASIGAGVASGIAFFEGISNGIQNLSKSTIGANASMEQYVNTLTTVLKSNEKAMETLAWAEKFAAATPFEIPDIVEATTRLSAYGLKAQDVLEQTGNMAAVMGKPLMQAVEAVADAQTGELERLKEFGITKQMLIDQAKKIGLQEVVNARGEITNMEGLNKALFSLMEDRYKGGMELQSKTFNGMVSNAKDAIGTLMREISKPIFETLKTKLESVIPILSGFITFVRGDATGAINELTSAFGADKAEQIMGYFERIRDGGLAFVAFLKSWIPVIKNVFVIIQNLSPILIDLGVLIAVVLALIRPLLEVLTGMIATMTQWEGFIPLLWGIAAGFATFKTTAFIVSNFTKVMTAAKLAVMFFTNPVARSLLITQLWTKAQALFNATMLANPIVLIITLIVALGVALFVAYQKSETFRNIVNGIWEWMKSAWTSILNFFTTTIPQWASTFWQGLQSIWSYVTSVWNSIYTFLVSIFMTIYNGVMVVFNGIYLYFQMIWGSIYAVFSAAVQTIWTIIQAGWEILKTIFATAFLAIYYIVTGQWDKLGALFQAAWLKIQSIVLSMWLAIQGIWQGAVSTIVGYAVSFWQYLVNLYNNGISQAIALIVNFFNSMVSWFANLPGRISSYVLSLWQSIRNWFSNGASNVSNIISNLINSIISWFANLPGRLYTIGVNIIQGLINGVKSMGSSFINGITGLVSNGVEAAKKFLRIHSPSRVFMEIGKFSGEGLAVGMEKMGSFVGKAAQAMAMSGPEALSDLALGVPGVGGLNIQGISSSIVSQRGNQDTKTQKIGPIILQIPINGRILSEEIYEDIRDLIDFEKNRKQQFAR